MKGHQFKQIAVIGGGSWATALIKILSDNKAALTWWLREPSSVEYIRRYKHNPKYLSSVQIPLPEDRIKSDLQDAVESADCIVLAVPAAFLQKTLSVCAADGFKGKTVVSAIKGIVPDHNLLVADFMNQTYGVPLDEFVVLTGPCHAEEVALEKLSYLTVASISKERATSFASCLANRYVKALVSNDIYGTEYASVLKNVVAIACGICHGLGYGDNFQAVLVSNAIQEMKRFVDHVHPIERDIKDSAYLGDLLVTAYSQFSRNRTFGNMIGKGYSVRSAQLEMNMIAEGYFASNSIFQINLSHHVRMPIMESVYRILYMKTDPRQEIQKLADQLT